MQWIGKLLGGAIGLAIGGPLGAILGVSLGHILYYKSERLKESIVVIFSPKEKNQVAFFVATFSMLAKLSKADGKVTNKKILLVKNFINKDLKLDNTGVKIAAKIFNSALNSSESFDDFVHEFYDRFYNRPKLLKLLIDIMLKIAIVDGHLSKAEERLLISASKIFKLNAFYEQLKLKYIDNDLSTYYAVLDCKKNDSVAILKNSYRRKIQKYHPDKIAYKDLPDEFIKVAKSKFVEIQEAWFQIKKEREIK